METNENKNLLQSFLTMYYVLDSVCSDFQTLKEQVEMYVTLAEVFCLYVDDTLHRYFSTSQEEQFRKIKDRSDYNRLSRLIHFAQTTGQEVEIDETDSIILSQKREAMIIIEELFDKRRILSKNNRIEQLLIMARQGNIAAMGALAFLEYNGYCIDVDRESAIRRLRACSKWNDLFGTLMGICYDAENAQLYYNRLYTILRHVSQREMLKCICTYRSYEDMSETDEVARILEKGFEKGIIKRSAYDRDFAKVAFSVLLTVKDREKLLLHRKEHFEMGLPNLPFEVSNEGSLLIDRDYTALLPLNRKNEQEQILDNLSVTQNCPPAARRPLLIVSSDPFVSKMYKDMLLNCIKGVKTVLIDADKLDQYDVTESETNVFVRSLSETGTTRTVFIIENCDEANGEIMGNMINMLEFEYRKKFALNNVPISLDLSESMFVLFSAGNCRQMSELIQKCDVVRPEVVSREEKSKVIDTMFRASADEFGLRSLQLEEAGNTYLQGHDTQGMQTILYDCMKTAAREKLEIITEEMLRAVRVERKKTPSLMGFAYTGGNGNA